MLRTLRNLIVPVVAAGLLLLTAGRGEAQWSRPYVNSQYSYYTTPGSGYYTPGFYSYPSLYAPAVIYSPVYTYYPYSYSRPYSYSYSMPSYGYRYSAPRPYGWYY
jgi:hypothetical protein